MSTQIKITGVGKLRLRLAAFNRKKRQQIQDAVFETAINVQRKARKLVPKDTAALAASIQLQGKKSGLKMVVGSRLPYAAFIEFHKPVGTGPHGGPQPYLAPAVRLERSNHISRLKKVLRRK